MVTREQPKIDLAPYYRAPGIDIYQGQCQDVFPLAQLPAIRVTISDPPYWGQAYIQGVTVGATPFDINIDAAWGARVTAWYLEWLPVVLRINQAGEGRCWLFAGPQHFPWMRRAADLCGHRPVRNWEFAGSRHLMLYGRQIPQSAYRSVEDVFMNSPHGNLFEPWLLDALLDASGADGAVLDPFMGQGSVLLAARRAELPCIGIEMREEVCAIAKRRLIEQVIPEIPRAC